MTDQLLIDNRLPAENATGGIRLGVVFAQGVSPDRVPKGFEESLSTRLAAEERGEVPAGFDVEARRLAARDMLRNGRYKPTGRGKPASEYLVRAAAEGSFPRINSLVDINNLISLEERLPISMWDVDLAGVPEVRFRLGREGERFIFNPAGQELDIHDLAVGCAIEGGDDRDGEPFASPIKDAQHTKTLPVTKRVGVAIYAPLNQVDAVGLAEICERFGQWLMGCGDDVKATLGIAAPGDSVVL